MKHFWTHNVVKPWAVHNVWDRLNIFVEFNESFPLVCQIFGGETKRLEYSSAAARGAKMGHANLSVTKALPAVNGSIRGCDN
jgi:hypothetical protein